MTKEQSGRAEVGFWFDPLCAGMDGFFELKRIRNRTPSFE
jgi:hypothetical protein